VLDAAGRHSAPSAYRISTRFDGNDEEVVAGHAGPAYGVPHAATIGAIKFAGALEALTVDLVYSRKGLADLIVLVRERRWQPDTDVIFIHTGGASPLCTHQGVLGI
jgi:L-cysteate sulfo-lyase